MDVEHREQAGIEKMLTAAGIQADEKLIKAVLRLKKTEKITAEGKTEGGTTE